MINLRFVNVVWGDAYTDTFVNVCLPSTLSAGNLGYVSSRSRSSYRIYTTARDAEKIVQSTSGKHLARLVNLEIIRVDTPLPIEDPAAGTTSMQKYHAMSFCHTHFIKTAGSDGSAMVFLSPDLFWADGSFRRLLDVAQSGKRLLMMGALRLAKESFVATLQQNHTRNGQLQPIGKRDLVGLALNHLHPETESLVWDSGATNAWPSLLLWKAQQEGLMLRAFHLHPLMVRPSRRDVFPKVTIDDDYIAHACPNPEDEYIVTDSDDMVAFELSRRSSRSELISAGSYVAANLAQWARAHANPKHRRFVRSRIRLHTGDLSPAWAATEQQSDQMISEIDSLLTPNACVAAS